MRAAAHSATGGVGASSAHASRPPRPRRRPSPCARAARELAHDAHDAHARARREQRTRVGCARRRRPAPPPPTASDDAASDAAGGNGAGLALAALGGGSLAGRVPRALLAGVHRDEARRAWLPQLHPVAREHRTDARQRRARRAHRRRLQSPAARAQARHRPRSWRRAAGASSAASTGARRLGPAEPRLRGARARARRRRRPRTSRLGSSQTRPRGSSPRRGRLRRGAQRGGLVGRRIRRGRARLGARARASAASALEAASVDARRQRTAVSEFGAMSRSSTPCSSSTCPACNTSTRRAHWSRRAGPPGGSRGRQPRASASAPRRVADARRVVFGRGRGRARLLARVGAERLGRARGRACALGVRGARDRGGVARSGRLELGRARARRLTPPTLVDQRHTSRGLGAPRLERAVRAARPVAVGRARLEVGRVHAASRRSGASGRPDGAPADESAAGRRLKRDGGAAGAERSSCAPASQCSSSSTLFGPSSALARSSADARARGPSARALSPASAAAWRRRPAGGGLRGERAGRHPLGGGVAPEPRRARRRARREAGHDGREAAAAGRPEPER